MNRIQHASIVLPATAAALLLACVQTDLEPIESELPCALARPEPSPQEAVVIVRAPVENRFLTICSGTALTPRLIATQLKCVLGRSNSARTEDLPVPAPSNPPASLVNRSGSTDYAEQCQPARGWAPVEDGDFSARLGDRLDASIISVSRASPSPEVLGVGVANVYVMPASSLCGDDLALIALEDRLDVPLVGIRFGETAPGQQLLLSGFCADATTSTLERRESASLTRVITTTAATQEAPPRSFVVSNSVAAFGAGGAAIATDTGAIVGIIMSGTLIGTCDMGDLVPEATTLVMSLAPYRRFLLDVAAHEGETLYSEVQSDGDERPCQGGSG